MKQDSFLKNIGKFTGKKHQELTIQSFLKLKAYVEKYNYKGWDPFDGMNSSFFQATPLKKIWFFRMAWIQLFKRSPVNLRPLFCIPKQYNTKGLGLFLHGYCKLYLISKTGINTFGKPEEIIEKINLISEKVIELKSEGYSGACWGYNFDWQSRVFFQPKYTPTVVATSFVADALFEAWEITKNQKYLDTALSACEFIINDLNKSTDDSGGLIFSYSPKDYSQVYNASLLGARLLARGYYYTQNEDWKETSKRAVNTVISLQNPDGSWVYGSKKNQQWIDSFHTGFNLECIYEYKKYTNDISFDKAFMKGMEFYLTKFFKNDGTPAYFHNKVYPIDIHSPAQLIATLIKTNLAQHHLQLIEKVLSFTMKNMQSKKGYFFYQLKPILSSKIPYMRWAQAWMFYAFSLFFNYPNQLTGKEE